MGTARSLLGDKSEVPPLMPIFITVIGIILVSLTLLAVMLYYVIMCFRPAPTAPEESCDYYDHIHGRMQRTHARQTLERVKVLQGIVTEERGALLSEPSGSGELRV